MTDRLIVRRGYLSTKPKAMRRAYESGVQLVHRSGAWRVKKGPWTSEGPHSHGHFILIFPYFLVFSTIFSLFRYVIWTFCCTGNKAFMKVYQWFYWNSNLQFWEKSQPVPGAPLQSCFALQNFSWRPWSYGQLTTNTTKHWGELGCFGLISSSFFTSRTHRFTVKRHEHRLIWKSCCTPPE